MLAKAINGIFTVLWASLAAYCLYAVNSPLALVFSLATIANIAVIIEDIKPRYVPAREYWLNVFTSSYCVAFDTKAAADARACDRKECIKVREVKS